MRYSLLKQWKICILEGGPNSLTKLNLFTLHLAYIERGYVG